MLGTIGGRGSGRKGMEARPDVLVVGAGIFGLSCAFACAGRGLRVLVAERAHPGAGASGGPVGAMAPHLPEPWSARKQFQLDALLGAEAHWHRIAAAGGGDPGYARIGRLVPLGSAAARARAAARAEAAAARWPDAFRWQVMAGTDRPEWLAPAAAAEGAVHETLSARLNPPAALAALVAALRAYGVEIRCGWTAEAVEDHAVSFDRGRIGAGAVILAAGASGVELAPQAPVQGVKGQAARLAVAAHGLPMLAADGIYVVPHADGTVAVGSTSEEGVADTVPDARLEALLARAKELCPSLRGARVLERWVGLRPRGPRPDPMLGPLPGRRGVFVANGGFRTGLALGRSVGELMAAMVSGEPVDLPPGYSLAEHLAARVRLRR